MQGSPIREKLYRGEVSIGTWLNLASPGAAELLANAGFDWLVVDAEHSQWDLDLIAHAFRAIEAQGAVPMARTWSDDPTALGRLLDAGAMGIVIPHVSTPEQAESIARSMRYPPRGDRSAGSGRAVLTASDYRAAIDDEVLVIPQIENMEGVRNIDGIMAVEGVDVAFLGPNDLGLSMGLSPDLHGKDSRHLDAIAAVLEGAKKAGKPAGLPAANVEAAKQQIQQGFLMIDLSSDMRMLQGTASAWLEELRS